MPDAHVENAIALDEPHRRLFTATRQPARFFVFDIDNGKVVGYDDGYTLLELARKHYTDVGLDLALLDNMVR